MTVYLVKVHKYAFGNDKSYFLENIFKFDTEPEIRKFIIEALDQQDDTEIKGIYKVDVNKKTIEELKVKLENFKLKLVPAEGGK